MGLEVKQKLQGIKEVTYKYKSEINELKRDLTKFIETFGYTEIFNDPKRGRSAANLLASVGFDPGDGFAAVQDRISRSVANGEIVILDYPESFFQTSKGKAVILVRRIESRVTYYISEKAYLEIRDADQHEGWPPLLWTVFAHAACRVSGYPESGANAYHCVMNRYAHEFLSNLIEDYESELPVRKEAKEVRGLVDSLNAEMVRFKMAKRREGMIVAIDTSWMPEEQLDGAGLTGLLTALTRLPRRSEVDNIGIVRGKDKDDLLWGIRQEIARAARNDLIIPNSNIYVIGKDEIVKAMAEFLEGAKLATMDLSEFAPNGDVRIVKIINALLRAKPDQEKIVVDNYLTITRDRSNPNSYLVHLKAEPLGKRLRDRYELLSREIDTRA